MERADDTSLVADLLPGIIRGLFAGRPVPSGLRALTFAQMRALRAIASSQTCTMGELAKGLHITLGAATGLVDRLVQHGLVQREADPEDRRVVRVRLTQRGWRAHAEAMKETKERLTSALGMLTPEQRGQVVRALSLLRDALCRPGDVECGA